MIEAAQSCIPEAPMPVVVVESPAKAKTIEKYLGPDYRVLASFGHVRDLPEKNGSVDPDNDFAMKWEVQSSSQKQVKAIADALATDNELILATDPDREGEAISWHVQELLRRKRGVKLAGEAKRVVFNAVTKPAVQAAMHNPRTIDMELVDAYLARRALDYLVGYTLSPVLWRKLPGARSAGRVQSVCVRLIVERESEIEAFKPLEYWSVVALLRTKRGEEFHAKLTKLDGRKLKKHDLSSKEVAETAVESVRSGIFHVAGIESKPATRNPSPPFVTATLQQEASLKLKFNPRRTMRVAQALYEAGLITYMRTDGIDMAPEAVEATRVTIRERFGSNYLPKTRRTYKNKAKNAQEAHECIRPTNMSLDAGGIRVSEADQRKLYELIWKRTIASQMESARFLQTTCELISDDGKTGLRATGRVIKFDGFLKLLSDTGDSGRNGKEEDRNSGREGENAKLPKLEEGEKVDAIGIDPGQHFTQPPPRYTEASLVKKMVELGIGRPSTYSSIVATIQDRGYVAREKNNLIPRGTGRMLIGFLMNYFATYVGYEFTAGLEEELDDVSGGRKRRLDVLEQFWRGFSDAVAATNDLRIGEVLNQLSDMLVPQLLPGNGADGDLRVCPKCGNGRLTLRTGRGSGPYLSCSSYPECPYVFSLDGNNPDAPIEMPAVRQLGADPETGLEVTARAGRYGPYLQLGERSKGKKKPKSVSIPKEFDPSTLSLETALELLSLPRLVGRHPEDNEPIEAGLGRYGPYLKHGKRYESIADPNEVLTLGMNRAMELLAQPPKGKQRRATGGQGKELGEHPNEGGMIRLMQGRYGPYVKWNKVNASLPKGADSDSYTIEQAVDLIERKRSAGK